MPFLTVPSISRDVAGRIIDITFNLLDIWTQCLERESMAFAQNGIQVLSTRSELLKRTDGLKKSSLDLYAAVLSLYRQRRLNDISYGYSGDLSTIHSVSGFPNLNYGTQVEEISTKP